MHGHKAKGSVLLKTGNPEAYLRIGDGQRQTSKEIEKKTEKKTKTKLCDLKPKTLFCRAQICKGQETVLQFQQ